MSHVKDPQRRSQAATVAAFDDSLGEVMAELRRSGLLEQTCVLFQSDNGRSVEKRNLPDDSDRPFHSGNAGPFRGNKGSLFEGGIRMPAMMSRPGTIPAGQVVSRMGVAMDNFFTFVNLAGGKIPDDRVIDGQDVFSMIAAGAPSPHIDHPVFWAYGDRRSVRPGRNKLILNPKPNFDDSLDDKTFLVDLEADPGEKTNLATRQPALVSELRELIENWGKEVVPQGGPAGLHEEDRDG